LEGGTSSDFVELNISGSGGTVFQTPYIGAPGALNGTATSVLVPAGTLQPGINYSARIIYGQLAGPVDTTDYPGVNGYPVFATETDFSIQTLSTLTAPQDVTASQGTFPHHTTITWAAVSGAASYQVYRSTVNDFADANKLVGGVVGTSYSDTAAAPGVLHYYWVLARNGMDIGPESAAVSGFTELNAPAGFESTGALHHVQLTWDAAVNAASYQIFRGTTSDFSSATRIATGLTTTFFDDTTAVLGQNYFYWVRAKNALGVGAAAGPDMGALT
jgi:fibronectin type 3 domain-containing protein